MLDHSFKNVQNGEMKYLWNIIQLHLKVSSNGNMVVYNQKLHVIK